MSNYIIDASQPFARSRLVSNMGEIVEGCVKLSPAGELCGLRVSAPPSYLWPKPNQRYKYDHLTENGVAVYLEEA